jgi:hypothetical protein
MMKSTELRFFHDGATVHHLTFDRTLFVQP